jgi:8-oxo-dGTP pyrophosphatase MutT (NUDIX family)
MPYKLQKSGDKFCVVKTDGSSVPGGCHAKRADAVAHLQALYANVKDAAGHPVAAGIMVLAADTGRVLMLQRSNDPEDPAGGTWEFPGGCLEDGEAPFEAAKREWQEETGVNLPDGRTLGSWDAPNGLYQGFAHEIPSEGDLPLNVDHDDRKVLNPDDPDGDDIEVVAWWDPQQLPGNPGVRPELRDGNWSRIFDLIKQGSLVRASAQPWSINTGGDGYGEDIKGLGDRYRLVQTEKVDKEAVHYRHSYEAAMCANCQNGLFVGESKEGTCLVVKGDIWFHAICDAYQPFAETSSFVAIRTRKNRMSDIAELVRSVPVGKLDEILATARDFTDQQRQKLAKQGKAMPGGRYPIVNRKDLQNAIHAVGRGKGDHDAIRAHIKKRAKAIGAEDLIPSSWGADGPDQ